MARFETGFSPLNLNFRRVSAHFLQFTPGIFLYFANGRARFSHGGLVFPHSPRILASNFPPQVAFQFFSVQWDTLRGKCTLASVK